MFRSNFTDAEWDTIMFTPLWAFGLVAAADSKIEEAEAGALAKEVAEAPLYKDDFTREVLSAIAAALPTVMPAFAKDSRSAIDGLRAAADLLDAKMPGGAANGFKLAVLNICLQAARAAGPRFGDKVSQEEKGAVFMVAATLRIPIPGV